MTAAAPIWMASPPEVHSALLSSGSGPGPLLASAAAWSLLSNEYTAVADELTAVLGAVQSGAYQGPSAESYVAAHAPYLAWLNQASADSAASAVQLETAAGSYVSALAAMPTMAELAANHATHGVLVATNFFGINTIPIALNEADYGRMWVQAATVMGTYQAVAGSAVASVPQTAPAPQIVKTDATQAQSADDDENPLGLPQWLVDELQKLGIGNSQLAHDPTISNGFDQYLAQILQNFGYNWNPSGGTLNGFDYDYYTHPAQLSFWVARALELLEDFQYFGQLLSQNPVQAIQWFISWQLFDFPTHILEVAQFLAENPALIAALAVPAVAPLGAAGGLAGLAGLAALPPPAPATVPIVAVPDLLPAFSASTTPAVPPAPAPAPAPAPVPAAGGVGGPPPPAPPVGAGSVASATFLPYLLGPPGIGTGSGMTTGAGASRKSAEPRGSAAVAAAAEAGREQRLARRRRRVTKHRSGDGVMDLTVELKPDWADPGGEPEQPVTASARGAQLGGITGSSTREDAPATGLTVSTGGTYDDGPRMPLLPGTWQRRELEGN